MRKILMQSATLLLLLMTVFFPACSGDDSDGGTNYTGGLNLSKTEQLVAKTGATFTISAQSNGDVTVSSSESWCTVVAGSRSTAMGVTPLTVTVDENTTYDERTATITVSCGSESKMVTVTQLLSEGLIVDVTSFDVPASGGTVTVSFKATGDVTANISEGWVSEAGTRTLSSYDMTFVVAANSGNARSTNITFTLGDLSESVTINQAAGESQNAAEIAKLMYPGWNLGNTMEAGSSDKLWSNSGINSETSWQSVKTTKEFIEYVASQGFKSVRIPTSWVMGHISDKTNCTIDDEWMNRVQEVVDYCISSGLYVIINDHWDGGWVEVNGFSESSSSYQAVSEATITDKISKLKKIWTQIAEHFKNYDQHLLFAGLNEPFQEYSLFSTRHQTLTPILERYNQAFVDAVRATGGNNVSRILVVQGPSTNIESTNKYFSMPQDTSNGLLMVEVHYYDPWNFTGGGSWMYWGNGNHVSGSSLNATYAEEDYVKSQMKLMYDKFASKGIPVVIGEYAADWYSGKNDDKHNASIKAWYKCVTAEAINNGAIPYVWDINSPKSASMTIFNRATKTVWNNYALSGIQEAVIEAKWPF